MEEHLELGADLAVLRVPVAAGPGIHAGAEAVEGRLRFEEQVAARMAIEGLLSQLLHQGGRQGRTVVGGSAAEKQLLRPDAAALRIQPEHHHPLAVGQLGGAGAELLEVEHHRPQLGRLQPLHLHGAQLPGELGRRRTASGHVRSHLAPVVEAPLPTGGDRCDLGSTVHRRSQVPRAASTALAMVRSKRVVSLMLDGGASSTRTGSPSRS